MRFCTAVVSLMVCSTCSAQPNSLLVPIGGQASSTTETAVAVPNGEWIGERQTWNVFLSDSQVRHSVYSAYPFANLGTVILYGENLSGYFDFTTTGRIGYLSLSSAGLDSMTYYLDGSQLAPWEYTTFDPGEHRLSWVGSGGASSRGTFNIEVPEPSAALLLLLAVPLWWWRRG